MKEVAAKSEKITEDLVTIKKITEDLVERYKDTLGEKHLYILDEATSLLKVSEVIDNTGDAKFISKFRVMRRAVKKIRLKLSTIAFILAATNGQMHEFVPNPRIIIPGLKDWS